VCVDRIVDGSNSNNLVEVIMNASSKGGRLTREDLSKKFVCLKVDKVNVFYGGKIGKLSNKSKNFGCLFPWVFIVMFI
jgi:hypothetical protein